MNEPDTAIRIVQLTGPTGAPSRAEYLKGIVGSAILPPRSVAIDFMAQVGATFSGQLDTYDYRHAGQGAGQLRLEGFSAEDLDRIADYFRVEAISAEIDPDRKIGQWVGINPYPSLPSPTRNPILMVAIAGVGLVVALVVVALSAWGPLRPPSPSEQSAAWMVPAAAGLVAALLAIIVIQHSRRIGWWLRARRVVRGRGEEMPRGLRSLE